MITPGYSVTATERVLPKLALDFTTATADARVTTSRAANTATRINASGTIEIVNANLPRFDFDPATLLCRGQLIEESRINLLLNSLINGTNLSTQSVTLSATAYTLSFYGSGSIVISGGHSATVAGTGNYPSRKTYSFTPTAGSSTFTVSGTVQYAQLEAGAFATSFIPTSGTSVTRNADAVSMTGTNFSDWYNAAEGTMFFEGSTFVDQGAKTVSFAEISNGVSTSFTMTLGMFSASAALFAVVNTTTQANIDLGAFSLNTVLRLTGAYKANSFAAAKNGNTTLTDTSGSIPAVSQLIIGQRLGGPYMNGHARKFFYWPQRLINAEVQAFSK